MYFDYDEDSCSSAETIRSSLQYNRWMRLVVMIVTLTTCTCFYSGWQHYSQILLRAGAYRWECEPGEESCLTQKSMLQSLFTIATCTEFTCGIAAGYTFDTLGPKHCAHFGVVLLCCGLTMVAYSSEAFPAFEFAFFLHGAAVNFIAFPSFALADDFPECPSFIVALVSILQTQTALVMPIVWTFWQWHSSWSMKTLMLGYLLFICVPSLLLYSVTMPKRRPKPLSMSDLSIPEEEKDQHSLRGLLLEFQRPRLLLFIPFSVVLVARDVYFPPTILPCSGKLVSDVVGWFMPTISLWGILFGAAVVKFSTFPVLVAQLVVSTSYFVLGTVNSTACRIAAGIGYVITDSFVYTAKYTYTQETCDRQHFGKVAGAIGLLAGLFGYLNILSSYFSYSTMYAFYIFLTLPCAGCLLGIRHLQTKEGRQQDNLSTQKLTEGLPPRKRMASWSTHTSFGTQKSSLAKAISVYSRSRYSGDMQDSFCAVGIH